MKKLLLILLFLSPLFSQAQTSVYHPFPEDSAVWMETNWHSDFPYHVDHDYILFIAGDTVIGSHQYKKLLSSGHDHLHFIPVGYNHFYNLPSGAFREDTMLKRVYYVPADSSNEQLLYDFNLSVGDTLPLAYNNWSDSITVTSIDSILMGTDYRKRFWLSIRSFNLPTGYGSLIEGMGSTFGFFDRMYEPFESGNYLNCFTVNGQTIFLDSAGQCNLTIGIDEVSNFESINISPNPAHDILNVECKVPNAELKIYDVTGREVYSTTLISKKQTLNLSLSPALYFVRLGNHTQKLIIE